MTSSDHHDSPAGVQSKYAEAEAALQEVQSQLDRARLETEGLGDELLRSFEQLGIVFQLTRQVSDCTHEDQVLDLLLTNLQAAYGPDRVFLAWFGENQELCTRPRAPQAPQRALQAALRSRDEERAVVVLESEFAPENGLFSSQTISAPIYCGSSFVAVVEIERSLGDTKEAAPPPRALDSGDMLLLDSLTSFCGDLVRNLRLTEAMRQASIDTVRALVSAVDQKDAYTSGHSNRVGYYAGLLGRELGLDAETLQTLNWAALLHDVGKIGIRDDVLKKEGPLTDAEFEHIKEHPRRGYEVVRQIPHFSATLDGVLHHHEHFDGKGYPEGLAGTDIPLQARIIQIADVFDALTTSRAYRAAFSWTKALSILRKEAGTTVDPELAVSFDRLLMRLFEQRPEAFDQIGQDVGVPRLEVEGLPA